MPHYRRLTIAGGTYFFTQVTHQRQPWLCKEFTHPIGARGKSQKFRWGFGMGEKELMEVRRYASLTHLHSLHYAVCAALAAPIKRDLLRFQRRLKLFKRRLQMQLGLLATLKRELQRNEESLRSFKH